MFRIFGYGRAINIENYDNIILPVNLHYVTNNVIDDVRVCIGLRADFQLFSKFSIIFFLSMVLQGVLELYEILPNAQKFLVPCDVFVHFDFVWGEHVNTF